MIFATKLISGKTNSRISTPASKYRDFLRIALSVIKSTTTNMAWRFLNHKPSRILKLSKMNSGIVSQPSSPPSLTTKRFGELSGSLMEKSISGEEAYKALGNEFRTPGHIPVCRESPGGLKSRQGHTELAVAIARLAGQVPATIGAEMLQPDGDGALSVKDARAYAAKHNIPMITGDDLLNALNINK